MKRSNVFAAVVALSGLAWVSCTSAPLQAADPAPSVNVDARPAFTILPLLQQYEARPGQRIKFGFQVETQERNTRLNIKIVGLKQDESGLILPDEEAPPPGNVQLFGPPTVELGAGEQYELEGSIVLPLDAANSISYGLLVTDLGRDLDPQQNPNESQVQVRFVTRYLLRVHIDIPTARPIRSLDLKVQSAELVEEQGSCLARVRVHNPSPGTCDVAVRCRLVPEAGPAIDPAFFLTLPVRRRTGEQLRPTCKLLGESTVYLESVVPHPVAVGKYRIEVDTMVNKSPQARTDFITQVNENQFPDHARAVLQIAGILRVEPAHVQLSLKPRGDRLTRMTISNASRRAVKVQLKPLASDGSPLPGAFVRPDNFQLAPGAHRNVLVGIQQASGLDKHIYGELSLNAETLDGVNATRRPIPLAILAPHETTPRFEIAPVRLGTATARPTLITSIRNKGLIHLQPRGQLRLLGADGELMQVRGDLGRWLLPGGTGELRFPLAAIPPTGEYRLVGEIDVGHNSPPHRIDQPIEIPTITTNVSLPASTVN